MIERSRFQDTINGKQTDLYRLENDRGTVAEFTNFGARIIALHMPDREGRPADIIVGPKSIAPLKASPAPHFGAVVGRYANRVAGGDLKIDGRQYQLPRNEGAHHLHGGEEGFHSKVWEPDHLSRQLLRMTYRSGHLEAGYPGELSVRVLYALSNDNDLIIDYTAFSDRTTVINLTNHAYFNLTGNPSGSIGSHRLQIHAHHYLPVDGELLPTGEVAPVANTPFDFIDYTRLGDNLEQSHSQFEITGGFDHNYILDLEQERDKLTHGADLHDPESGRELSVYTTEPGLQLYTASIGQEGGDARDNAICLETQHFPDSPHHPNFPPVRLEAGELFHSITIYTLSASETVQ